MTAENRQTESLRKRLAHNRNGDEDPSGDDKIVAQGLEIASRRVREARECLQEIEQSREAQAQRLADGRSQADDERIKALAAEPWADVVFGIPTVDFSGMMTLPTINGKELFGTRLAFDLLGCCADEEQVAEKLRQYFRMVRDPGHMFLICASALDTIANHVVPVLLDIYEEQSGDYDARVRLADAARNAWTGRLADLGEEDGEVAE